MKVLISLLCAALVGGVGLAAGASTESAALAKARAELRDAEAEVARLRAEAEAARDDAATLAAERETAAAEISAAESRINTAEAELALRLSALERSRARLAEKQKPTAALIAGLVNMGRTPPLAAAADSNSLDELVRVRALLDTTLPYVRRQSRELADDYASNREAAAEARSSRNALADARQELEMRQADYLKLEEQVLARAESLDVEAVGAGDRMIILSEEARSRASAERRSSANRQLTADLGKLPPMPRQALAKPQRITPFAYRLPAFADVTSGLGSIDRAGIRSRGVTVETRQGDRLVVPASGTIRFVGPFQRHDGVIIIDHGNGWLSLITGVSSEIARGSRVRSGEELGRALGPITVELSRNGRHISPAVAASRSLAIKAGRG